MRFNSALLLSAFVAGTASFVAANDLNRPADAAVSGHAKRNDLGPEVHSSGVGRRDEPAPAETSTAAPSSTTSFAASPSETPGAVMHNEDVAHAVDGGNSTVIANATTTGNDTLGAAQPGASNATNATGGAMASIQGISAGALLVPLGMVFGALVLGSGALLA